VLLKIFNYNLKAGVVGVFHARYGEGVGAIQGGLRPSDVPGLQGEQFAVYAHQSGSLRSLSSDEVWEINLEPLAFEVFTIVPIQRDFAPVGLVDYFNSAGALTHKGWQGENIYRLGLRAGGSFLAWSRRQPARLLVDGERQPFRYDSDTCRLTVECGMDAEPHELEIEFSPPG
jgi:raffinose synthase